MEKVVHVIMGIMINHITSQHVGILRSKFHYLPTEAHKVGAANQYSMKSKQQQDHR